MNRHQLSDIEYLPLWPCIVTIEDCYVPDLAAQALEATDTIDPAVQALAIKWWAESAMEVVGRN